MPVKISEDINDSFLDYLHNGDRRVFLWGGAGAGKSYTSIQKVILKCLLYPNRKIMLVRKTMPALRATSIAMLEGQLKKYQLPYYPDWQQMKFNFNGNQILFRCVVSTSGEPAERPTRTPEEPFSSIP